MAGEENAIIEASKIIRALRRFKLKSDVKGLSGSVTPLSIRSSESILTNPDICMVRIDLHYPPRISKLRAKKIFEKGLSSIQNLRGRLEIKLMKRPTPYMEPYYLKDESEMLKIAASIYSSVFGESPKFTVSESVNDSNYLVNKAGIETIVFGPSGVGEHSPDEYVIFDSVVKSAIFYRELISRLCL